MNLIVRLATVYALTLSVTAFANAENSESVVKIVSEGISLSAHAKLAVSEYYLATGEWPSSNDSAAYEPPTDTSFAISVGKGGVVEIIYSAPKELAGLSVMMRPTPGDGVVHWACESKSIPDKFLPTSPMSCR